MTDPAVRRRRRLIPRGGYLAIALLAVGGLWTVLAPSGAANTKAPVSYEIAAGKALFEEGCASCHGDAAQGGVAGALRAPTLIGVGAAAVDFQMSTGRMPLSAPGAEAQQHRQTYTRTEILQIAAYIASLAPGPGIPNTSGVSTADVALGGELFRANCAQCHNASAAGGALVGGAYAPSMRGINARLIEEAMITGPENMPVYGPDQLSQAQKNAIVAYVIALRHTGNPGGDSLGRIGPVSEGAVGWIAGLGSCAIAAMWLTARRHRKKVAD
jgi:ubiquinol-cytochrome c reductase cytochrome c subunit